MLFVEFNEEQTQMANAYKEGYSEGFAEGYEEGYAEGFAEGRLKVLISLVMSDDITIETALDYIDLTKAEFEKFLNEDK